LAFEQNIQVFDGNNAGKAVKFLDSVGGKDTGVARKRVELMGTYSSLKFPPTYIYGSSLCQVICESHANVNQKAA